MSLKYVKLYLNSGVAAENTMVTDVYTHVPQKFPSGTVCPRLWYNIPSLRSAAPLWVALNLSLFQDWGERKTQVVEHVFWDIVAQSLLVSLQKH